MYDSIMKSNDALACIYRAQALANELDRTVYVVEIRGILQVRQDRRGRVLEIVHPVK